MYIHMGPRLLFGFGATDFANRSKELTQKTLLQDLDQNAYPVGL